VANVARMLAEMNIPNAGGAFSMVLDVLRRDMVGVMGWSADDADAFAIEFGRMLTAALNDIMHPPKVLH
jgi:hypothetical protein